MAAKNMHRLPKEKLKNRLKFSNNKKMEEIPERPGVYAIWKGEDLLYVGMAGRGWDNQSKKKGDGNLKSRLQNHAKARRNNILAYYLIENYVGTKITSNKWKEFREPGKEKTLQNEVRNFIKKELTYSYAVAENTTIKKGNKVYSGKIAADWENQLIDGALDGKKPEFNIK